MQNGPSSVDPHTASIHDSSDNDDDSETDNEALQKEISHLREKYVTHLQSHFTLFFLISLSLIIWTFLFSAYRHMKEIQALQTRQKEEIDALFTKMGKHPPASVISPAVVMAGGRRRLKSKTYKSTRSSGQPSPIHSGQDTELSLQFFVL